MTAPATSSELHLVAAARPNLPKLAALWQQVQQFGADIENVPVEQIRAELQKYESAILTVIEADLAVLLAERFDRSRVPDVPVTAGRAGSP